MGHPLSHACGIRRAECIGLHIIESHIHKLFQVEQIKKAWTAQQTTEALPVSQWQAKAKYNGVLLLGQ